MRSVRRFTTTRFRTPWWATMLLTFGVILTMISAVSVAAGAFALHRLNGTFRHAVLLTSDSRTHRGSLDGPLDFLLAGSNLTRTGGHGGSGRSTGGYTSPGDGSGTTASGLPEAPVVMWMHITAHHDRAYVLSFDRNLQVQVPAYPHSRWHGGTDVLRRAFTHGATSINDTENGMRLLGRTLTGVTGVRFDMAGLVDLDGFTSVTRQLGGVTMCLDRMLVSTAMTFPQGCHQYTAEQALQLVRLGDDVVGNDTFRQQLHQQYTRQILRQGTSMGVLTNPRKLDRVLRAAGRSVTLDLDGHSASDMVMSLRHISADDIVSLHPPQYPATTGQSTVLAQPDADQLFRAMGNDTVDQLLRSQPQLAPSLPG